MKTRRHIGIIKYGDRKAFPKGTKFQAGGAFSSYAPGYDWRNDPYEMALMKKRLYEDTEGKSKSKSGTGKSKGTTFKDYKKFEYIKEGLPGTRGAINKLYEQEQLEYESFIDTNGPQAVNSPQGASMYNKLVRRHAELSSFAKDEKERWEAANKAMTTQDRESLAISGNLDKFVSDATTGELKSITHKKYLEDTGRYKIRTIAEFADWKQNIDDKMTPGLINKFMVNGAMGEKKMYDQYVEPRDKNLQYKIYDNKTMVRTDGAKDMLIDIDSFRKMLHNMENGAPANTGLTTSATQTNAMEAALFAIASDLLSFADDDTDRFQNSVMSAVLKDRRIQGNLHAMKADGNMSLAETRQAYLTKQMQFYVVNLFVDKGVKRSSDSGGGDGGGANSKWQFSYPTLALKEYIDSPNRDNFTIGVPINMQNNGEVEERFKPVNTLKTIHAKNVLKKSKLDLIGPKYKDPTQPQIRNTRLRENALLNDQASVRSEDIYTETGLSLESLLPPGTTSEFMKNIVLKAGEGMDLVMMPVDSSGKMIADEIVNNTALEGIKLKAKRNFIAYRKKVGRPIVTPAKNLLAGNTTQQAKDDYAQWRQFLKFGEAARDITAKYKDSKVPSEVAEREEAKYAGEVMLQTASSFSRIYGKDGKRVTLQPFYVASVYMVDNKNAIAERYEELTDGKIPVFKEVGGGDVETFMVKTMLLDPPGINWDGEFLETKILIKALLGAKIDDTSEDIGALSDYTKTMMEGFNSTSLFTNATVPNIADFLID